MELLWVLYGLLIWGGMMAVVVLTAMEIAKSIKRS